MHPDTSRNPDFRDRDGGVVRGQSLCAGVTDITLLMDFCRGAMVIGAAVADPTLARACC
ncbi:hypothetical protein GWK16_05220 [Roseomonas sp. JC162]|uniref:Uncharacterized protein n=1 Tax=Neoroseomonas marina TaxID=1232220 RepID=A0A848EAQ5_9PROT|nr:hypothetical protein [Neoroseomonas marina]NMJ40629.1 hypothetical protein [Neoroseomonas marina]